MWLDHQLLMLFSQSWKLLNIHKTQTTISLFLGFGSMAQIAQQHLCPSIQFTYLENVYATSPKTCSRFLTSEKTKHRWSSLNGTQVELFYLDISSVFTWRKGQVSIACAKFSLPQKWTEEPANIRTPYVHHCAQKLWIMCINYSRIL